MTPIKLMVVLLVFVGSGQLYSAEKAITLVMLGDSVTAGGHSSTRIPELVQEILKEKHAATEFKVINAGRGGETAGGGLLRLDKEVIANEPDIVTISYGLNDLGAGDPELFRSSMEKIIIGIQQKTQAKILLVTCTPFDNTRHFWGKDYVKKGGLDHYLDSAICKQTRMLAQKYKLPIADVHAYFEKKLKNNPALIKALLLPDGVHLTDKGNKVAVECLVPAIESVMSGRPDY